MFARGQHGAAASPKISVIEPVSARLFTARACSTQAGLSILEQSDGIRPRGWRLILRVFLPFTAAFFLSYLFRTINALISSELSSELALDAADLGFLTSVYFLTFAAIQLPVGIWLDRYGPRRVEGALLLIAAAGAMLFSLSTRIARIIVIEKALEDRVEIIEAKTRTPGSPYYQINPSGRVPYLIDEAGVGMEDSQLICAFLDGLDGRPRFHNASHASDWAYLRLEFAARSMCEGIAVWGREMARPENERSPTTLAHESARAQRMADFFEDRITDPLMQGGMARLILAIAVEMARKRGLGDLTAGRRRLASWMRSVSDLPSMKRTVPP
jgi:glutathione S-transferase